MQRVNYLHITYCNARTIPYKIDYHYYQHTPTSLLLIIICKYKITMPSLVFNIHQNPRYNHSQLHTFYELYTYIYLCLVIYL